VAAHHFERGGEGARELAAAVWEVASEGAPSFRLLYPDDLPLVEKIETIAVRIYGAAGVDFAPAAARALERAEALGLGRLQVCMAKTQYSLSHDPTLLGRPSGFRVPVRDVRLAVGAGFVTPLLGEMRTMPGLPSRPGGEQIDIDERGQIVGLF
jgi:formyltetrahydrofolate synthetase